MIYADEIMYSCHEKIITIYFCGAEFSGVGKRLLQISRSKMNASLGQPIIFSRASYPGANPNVVGSEANLIVGALFKKNNTKRRIKN